MCLFCRRIEEEIRRDEDKSRRRCVCGTWHPYDKPDPVLKGKHGRPLKEVFQAPEKCEGPSVRRVEVEQMPWPDGKKPEGFWSLC